MKTLSDYTFEFVENLSPVLNKDGCLNEYYPQDAYKNLKGLSLNTYGYESFTQESEGLDL